MNETTNFDIDYEHMDDLPLLDRIEWSHAQTEKTNIDFSNSDQINKLISQTVIKNFHT